MFGRSRGCGTRRARLAPASYWHLRLVLLPALAHETVCDVELDWPMVSVTVRVTV